MTNQERFWSKVNKDGPVPQHRPDIGACWVWHAGTYRYGYGKFFFMGGEIPAHRFSFLTENGGIPAGACVLHHCDNPSCVRPEHLFLGSRNDNNQDKLKKGRQPHGEKVGGARLTPNIVLAIRREYVPYVMGYKRLAAKYGLSRGHTQRIVNGCQWSHVPCK